MYTVYNFTIHYTLYKGNEERRKAGRAEKRERTSVLFALEHLQHS